MGTLLPISTTEHEKSEKHNPSQQIQQQDVDAGALFVLKSKGIYIYIYILLLTYPSLYLITLL
jgi:hypothetical protein